jgi:hypothetical protein
MIVVGQRYKSLAEPDLGVGEVVGLDKMNFAIQFPRTGEQRIYRQKGAPVERYAYEVGDVLNLEGGKVLTVAKIENVDGLNNYIGKAKSILESELPFTDEKSGENLLSSIFESPVEDIESWELRSRALE